MAQESIPWPSLVSGNRVGWGRRAHRAATANRVTRVFSHFHFKVNTGKAQIVTKLCCCIGLQELESHLLVPGDVLILPGKFSLPCDAVLIEGSCVVNEGMLTGRPLPWSCFFPVQHLGQVCAKQINVYLPASTRPRVRYQEMGEGDTIYVYKKHLTMKESSLMGGVNRVFWVPRRVGPLHYLMHNSFINKTMVFIFIQTKHSLSPPTLTGVRAQSTWSPALCGWRPESQVPLGRRRLNLQEKWYSSSIL